MVCLLRSIPECRRLEGRCLSRTVRRTRHLTVAQGTDDDHRNLAFDAEDLPGELDHLIEQGVCMCPAHAFPAKLAMVSAAIAGGGAAA